MTKNVAQMCDYYKYYEELKAEMEVIQQQMAQAKKNERIDAPKEVNLLCEKFDFTSGILKWSLSKGNGEK